MTKQWSNCPHASFQECGVKATHSKHTHRPVILRSFRAVASKVDGCGHGHHQPRNRVSTQVEILPPGVPPLEHLPLEQVQFHSFQTQPTKHREQRKVQQAGGDGAENLKNQEAAKK